MNLLKFFAPHIEAELKSLKDRAQQLIVNNLQLTSSMLIGRSLVAYDQSNYISDGYNRNAAVYSIVSKCARKFSQVPVNHYKLKRKEQKTWQEYIELTRDLLTPEAVREARIMRTKALEDTVVDSPLSRLLQNPNSHQSGSTFREQLYGYKLLTGEGDIWLNMGVNKVRPVAMEIIPKYFIELQPTESLWDIAFYIFVINGQRIAIPKSELIMWAFPNYNFNTSTLEHLRGFAPLNAGLAVLQSDNEAEQRQAVMNLNQGAAGLLYRTDSPPEPPSPAQVMEIRRQVNGTVNAKEMAGAIATLQGNWGYHQFGLDAGQLDLLNQSDANFDKLCRIFDCNPALFRSDQTYENQKEAKRGFIFDHIGPSVYSLRDLLNSKLLPAFGLDRETNVIDFEILSLPECAIDIKTVISAVKDADFLSQNEKRISCGYEPIINPEMDAIYMASGKQPIQQNFEGIADSLDAEQALLGE